MKGAAVRYSLAGMAGLALLSLGQFARGHSAAFGPVLKYVLGVLPNFAAAWAMPLIFCSFVATARDGQEMAVTERRFLALAAFTCAGLLGWELLQLAMPRFRFDWDDVVATFAGTFVAWVLYRLVRGAGAASTR